MKQVHISSLKKNLLRILSTEARRDNMKAFSNAVSSVKPVLASAGGPASVSAGEPASEALRISNSNQKSQDVKLEGELTQKIVN
jgi:hypothetical protein